VGRGRAPAVTQRRPYLVGVISVLYSPTAFLALSQGPLPHLAEELLLLVQPLSVLTFHLDLLFEHHHLSVDVRPLSRPPAPARAAAQPSREGRSAAGGARPDDEVPPDRAGAGGSPQTPGLVPGPEAGAALQQSVRRVLRWGDRLSRALRGAGSPPGSCGLQADPQHDGTGPGGWWGQLGQASRIYAAPGKEKFPFVWWTRLRPAAGDPGPGHAARPHVAVTEPRATELQLLQTRAVPELPAPKPGGGADASGTPSPEALALPAGAGARAEPGDAASGGKLPAASPRPRASGTGAEAGGPAGPDAGGWLGRLFGATGPSARSCPPGPDAGSARSR